MKYAVIRLAGAQHVVREGEELLVNKLEQADQKTFVISDVLLVVDEETRHIGTPVLEKASVACTVLAAERGEKIRVATFKAKSRTRKVRGHRQELTRIRIDSIKIK